MVEFAELIVNRESGIGCSWTPVGSSAVNIVTNEYKFREGSASERAALLGG